MGSDFAPSWAVGNPRFDADAWNRAGFDQGTLQIPARNTAAVVNIVRTLPSYRLANPAQQYATNGVTAAARNGLTPKSEVGSSSGARLSRAAADGEDESAGNFWTVPAC